MKLFRLFWIFSLALVFGLSGMAWAAPPEEDLQKIKKDAESLAGSEPAPASQSAQAPATAPVPAPESTKNNHSNKITAVEVRGNQGRRIRSLYS